MKKKLTLAGIFILSSAFAALAQAKSFEVANSEVRQGDVLVVRIAPQWQTPTVFNPAISVFGKYYLPNKYGEVFIGIELELKPGKYIMTLVEYGRGVRLSWDYEEVEVLGRSFPEVKLNRSMGVVDMVRWHKDRTRVNRAYTLVNRYENYADGRFVNPLDTVVVTDEFYLKRIFLDGIGVHRGTDLKAAVGTPVHAINSGVVILADRNFLLEGNMVIIDHGSGILSYYLHLSKINGRDGQVVKNGETIALSGGTGSARGPHLHLAVKVNGVNVDPLKFIDTMNQCLDNNGVK